MCNVMRFLMAGATLFCAACGQSGPLTLPVHKAVILAKPAPDSSTSPLPQTPAATGVKP